MFKASNLSRLAVVLFFGYLLFIFIAAFSLYTAHKEYGIVEKTSLNLYKVLSQKLDLLEHVNQNSYAIYINLLSNEHKLEAQSLKDLKSEIDSLQLDNNKSLALLSFLITTHKEKEIFNSFVIKRNEYTAKRDQFLAQLEEANPAIDVRVEFRKFKNTFLDFHDHEKQFLDFEHQYMIDIASNTKDEIKNLGYTIFMLIIIYVIIALVFGIITYRLYKRLIVQNKRLGREKERSQAILNTLPANIALLNHEGKILEVNNSWKTFAGPLGFIGYNYGVGDNYIHIARSAPGRHAEEGNLIAEAIEQIADRKIHDFSIEYPCHTADTKSWFKVVMVRKTEKIDSGIVVMHIDITEQKLAEINLELREKRFRVLVENGDMISLVNKDGILIYTSPAVEKTLGYSFEELFGKPAHFVIHHDHVSDSKEALSKLIDNPGVLIPRISKFMHKSGKEIWVEGTVINLLDDENINAIVSNYRDISSRVAAEQKIMQSEANLRLIIDLVPHLIFVKDINGKFILTNKRFAELYGISHSQDLDNKIFHDIIPINNKAQNFLKEDEEVINTGIIKVIPETHFTDSKGNDHLFHTTKVPYTPLGSTLKAILGVSIEITEQKKAEEKYRKLFHLSPIPMWVYDVDSKKFLNANEAAIKHYGYSIDEFLAMTIMDIRPAEDLIDLEKVIERTSKTNEFYNGQARHLKKDGTIINVNIQSNKIEFDSRNARLILATDISERVKYIETIEEQNRRLREISWIQSHLVRGPLSRIMGSIELLNNFEHDELTKLEIINNVLVSALELDDVIRDIVKKTLNIELQT